MGLKLPKSIIKKHGISKKAWRIFKASKSKTKSIIKSRTKTKIARVSNVARKRARRSKKSTGFKLPSGTSSIIGAVAYGLVRETLSDKLAQTSIVQQLPVTQFTDEGVMLAANWGLRKLGLGKMPIIGSVLRAQKTIELARVGQTIADLRATKTTGTRMGGIFIN